MGKLRLNCINSSKNVSIKTTTSWNNQSGCLKTIYNLDHLELTNPNYHLNNNLMLLHQNIRGLNNKGDEFSNFTFIDPPQVFCFSEHNLKPYQLDNILIQSYSLGAKLCWNTSKIGGVCIYTHDSVQFSGINVLNFCKEKDLNACAIKVHLPSYLCILYFSYI